MTGAGGMIEAMACIDLIETVREKPFWQRESFWKKEYEQRFLDEIVTPINNKIKEMENGENKN